MVRLLLVFVALAAARAQTPPALPSGYAGSAACRVCHPDVMLNFFKNPHYRSTALAKEPVERTGCESCHGPGKAHVEARGGRSNIGAFSTMAAKQILDTCLACHSKDLSRANVRRSPHTEAEVVCSSCHSIHKSPVPKFLLAKMQKDLCYQCHSTVRAQFEMPSKHRVNEGVVQCTDCHNPHGTFAATWRMGARPRMVDQALGNEEPCLKCHSDKRGPFLYEHAAVRVDGCESCHSPHGSMNPKLLRRPVVFTLCLECHNGAGTFGRRNTGVPLQSSSHNMLDQRFQRCTTCHVRIHGSNSDALFLR